QPKNTSRHSNGSSSSQAGPSGQRGSASGGSSQGQSSTPRPRSSNPGAGPVYEVWPVFTVNDAEATLLHHGYVLTEEQVKEAREEVAKGEMGRREDRKRARHTAGANRRRGSMSFLTWGG